MLGGCCVVVGGVAGGLSTVGGACVVVGGVAGGVVTVGGVCVVVGGVEVVVVVLVRETLTISWSRMVKVLVFWPSMVKTGSPQLKPEAAGWALEVSSVSVTLVPTGKVPSKVTGSPGLTVTEEVPVRPSPVAFWPSGAFQSG